MHSVRLLERDGPDQISGAVYVWKLQKADSARKELAVLDPKRSNVINIGLTVLPPPNTIKAAILKMDSAIMNREGIEVRHFCIIWFAV